MLGRLLAVGAGLELGEVAVVVALHLEVEDLRLSRGGRGDEVVVEQGEDGGADVGELLLDLWIWVEVEKEEKKKKDVRDREREKKPKTKKKKRKNEKREEKRKCF